MSDRPIIFSAPMIQALLAGGKTQTRRIIKTQPTRPECWAGTWVDAYKEQHAGHIDGERAIVRYEVGDRLWVRESFAVESGGPGFKSRVLYAAGGEANFLFPDDDPRIAWLEKMWTNPEDTRPSIHMPRWLSRLTLEVTNVRVQQLLDISEEDAAAEGFASGPIGDPMPERDFGDGWTISSPGGWASAAGHFQETWAKLHPDWDGYDSPWVVALTFTVVACNIDADREAA